MIFFFFFKPRLGGGYLQKRTNTLLETLLKLILVAKVTMEIIGLEKYM